MIIIFINILRVLPGIETKKASMMVNAEERNPIKGWKYMNKKLVSLGLILLLIVGMVSISGCVKGLKSLSKFSKGKKISKVVEEDKVVSRMPVKTVTYREIEKGEGEMIQPHIVKIITRENMRQSSQNSNSTNFSLT